MKALLRGCMVAAVLSAIACIVPARALETQTDGRVRTIVTTDPELDDNNSLIRFLLYANGMDVEGLVTASSAVHWKGDGKGTKIHPRDNEDRRFGLEICPCSEWRWYDGHIEDVLRVYEEVYDNLVVHDSGYPSPDYLRSVTREGNVEFPGDISKDTPGSNLVRDVLLDDEPGPVYLQVWGGPSTVARALLSIEETHAAAEGWDALRERVSGKAIIVAFGKQDSSYRNYIADHWPDVAFWEVASRTWGYGAHEAVPPEYRRYLGADWMHAFVTSVGPWALPIACGATAGRWSRATCSITSALRA